MAADQRRNLALIDPRSKRRQWLRPSRVDGRRSAAPYADYIKAHNHATDTSTEWVKRLIPLAEKTKVVIALENAVCTQRRSTQAKPPAQPQSSRHSPPLDDGSHPSAQQT